MQGFGAMPCAPPMSTEKALNHFSEHKREYLEDLKTLVRVPSVSFPGFDASNVRASAEASARLLRARGFKKVQLLEVEDAHPYVYGEILDQPGRPTVLLYAHHDVQPAGDESAWASPPSSRWSARGRLTPRRASTAGVLRMTRPASSSTVRQRTPGSKPVASLST